MKRLLIAFALVLTIAFGALFSPIANNLAVLAQTNTFCAANLTCTVTAAWSFSTSLTAKNFETTLYADQFAGADVGAQFNNCIAALPTAGGICDGTGFQGNFTLTTTITDGAKPVQLKFGSVNITSAVQAVLLTNIGSSILGIGDASVFTAAVGLPVATPLILASNSGGAGNLYAIKIEKIKLVNGRNSNVGLLQTRVCIRCRVADITVDGVAGSNFLMVGVENWDGFNNIIENIRCTNFKFGICVGVSAQSQNVDDITISNVVAFAQTAVALNYIANGNQPTLLDSTKLINVTNSFSTGPTAKFGVTTVSGAQASGLTTFNVASGAQCFAGYQVWIGDNTGGTNDEWNVVSSINANALTLTFATQRSHANGERVLCGNAGIHAGGNTSGLMIDNAHMEGNGVGIDGQGVQQMGVYHSYIIVTPAEGANVGDGIRCDPCYGALVMWPTFAGLTNELNITATNTSLGQPSNGVTLFGEDPIEGTASTNKGIVNNTGFSLWQFNDGCLGWVNGFGNCPTEITSQGGNIDLAANVSGGQATGTVFVQSNIQDNKLTSYGEIATPTGAGAGFESCYGDNTIHMFKCSYNNNSNGVTTFFPIPQTGNTAGTHSDSGFYQTATVAGCTTAASVGGVCASPITLTWPVTFADTNYKMSCSPNGAPTALPSTPYIVTKSANQVTMNYFAITAVAASWPNVECTAVHN